MVEHCAHFEIFLVYVGFARDLDIVVDSFITWLKSTLVGGAGLLWSTCKTWPKLLGAIAQLEWNLGGATSKATPARCPAGEHVAFQLSGGQQRIKQVT